MINFVLRNLQTCIYLHSKNNELSNKKYPLMLIYNIKFIKKVLIFSLLCLSTHSFAQKYADKKPTGADKMEWWKDAKFGMFIHWGLYAVPAGTYHGKRYPGIGEWIMNHGKIPVAEYKEYAKQFS